MKALYTLLALALVVGATSCSSSRNAQNTDDIYYSDGTRKAVANANGSGSNQGDYYSTAPSDNYVRMKAEDPERWSYFDDYNAYDAYYAPAAYGYGYGYPYMGMGYGWGLGFGYGLGFSYGLGLWDPYFAWNCWYNPYFYNPYYGGAVFVSGKTVNTAVYSNIRPFNGTGYRSPLTAKSGTSSGRFYRQGMSGTSAYNSGLSNQGRAVNTSTYRPANSGINNGGFRPASSFGTGAPRSSFGGGGGGGFRPGGGGGFGGRH
jgi:hypothetical protein